MIMKLLVVFAVLAYSVSGQDCDSARATFQTNNTACLSAFESSAGSTLGLSVNSTDIELICNDADCQSAIQTYVAACSLNESVTDIQGNAMLGCISIPGGGRCFDKIIEYGGTVSLLVDFALLAASCTSEYIFGMCSNNCTQSFAMLTNQLGCCYNEAVRIAITADPDTNSSQAEIDFSLSLYTKDYFSFCDLTAPTFCEGGTTLAPSPCAAAIEALYGPNDACANALRQSFTGDTQLDVGSLSAGCLSRFTTFSTACDFETDGGQLTNCETATVALLGGNEACTSAFQSLSRLDEGVSFREADTAMNTICGGADCRTRVDNFVNYCTDADEAQTFNIFVLDFGCRTNDMGSCLAVQQSGSLDRIGTAFDPESGGVCLTAALGTCSDQCKSVITTAIARAGCCVYEFAEAGLQLVGSSVPVTVDELFTLCEIDNPGRCVLQAAGTIRNITAAGDGDGGASAVMTYTLLISLLVLLPLLMV